MRRRREKVWINWESKRRRLNTRKREERKPRNIDNTDNRAHLKTAGPLRAVTFLPSLSTHSAKAPSGHSALDRLNINDPNAFSFFSFSAAEQQKKNDLKAAKAGKGVIFRIEFSDSTTTDDS
jgi:hypothetical protein